ncbi:MAG: tRNA (N(6)-L-threonylcarbamoyladenosine(37)-C(2))-methylthiotransferase MtaB [bacterium]
MNPPKDTRPVAAFITLGCRSNQYDTAAMMARAEAAGYRVMDLSAVPESAENIACFIINTCTVTHKSDYQCRQMVRRARRLCPDARIAATGCLAETDPDSLLAAGADMTAGPGERKRVVRFLGGREAPEDPFFYHPSGGRQDKSRAVVKVQDGCTDSCSYCIVPHARGKSRSLPREAVLDQLKCLASQGFAEVVITGVHLGLYGHDRSSSLEELLISIAGSAGMPSRVRLSSIEPQAVSARLIEIVAGAGLFCPHLHLPLQSGDAKVLSDMKRPYTPERFEDIVEGIITRMPDAGIGIDLIAGFPGESDEAHENTVALARRLPVSYFHVFPYSKRPGTSAARRTDQVPNDIIKSRAAELREIGREKKRCFLEFQADKVLKVLFESTGDSGSFGISENYVRVETDSEVRSGEIKPVKVRQTGPDSVSGTVCEQES